MIEQKILIERVERCRYSINKKVFHNTFVHKCSEIPQHRLVLEKRSFGVGMQLHSHDLVKNLRHDRLRIRMQLHFHGLVKNRIDYVMIHRNKKSHPENQYVIVG